MYEEVIFNSSTGEISPVKTKEEILLRIKELQNQYILLHRYGRDNFEYCCGDDWEHLKDQGDCQIFDSINDELDDLEWELKCDEEVNNG